VWSSRIASSAALFQSVTTSARARVPMRSAVEAYHERTLKVFISERLPNKGLLAVAALGWRHRGALPLPRDAMALVQVFTQCRMTRSSEWVNVNEILNKPVPLTPIRTSVFCPLTF
jgi:hypothetical protein